MRKQLYFIIKTLHLEEEVKAKYGKNYTQCTNEQLKEVVDKEVVDSAVKAIEPNCGSLCKLVEILAKKNILLKSEVLDIMNC